jgi:DNA-binding protein H-NS
MATRFNLESMEIDALIRLRQAIGIVLNSKAAELRTQLQSLESGKRPSKTRRVSNGRSLKGVKLAPKYRDTKDRSLVWAGRGARPRWMQERLKAGAKQEDFLIARPAKATASRKRKAGKKAGRRKKRA